MKNEASHMYKLQRVPASILNNPPSDVHAMHFREGSNATIANTSDALIYLWMKDDRQFWYYVTYSCDTYLEGYYWSEDQWTYAMFPLHNIKAYY